MKRIQIIQLVQVDRHLPGIEPFPGILAGNHYFKHSFRCNSLVYFNEYINETVESAEDFILTAYDGAVPTTGIKSNDSKTNSYSVRPDMIFYGNHLPSQLQGHSPE